MMSTRVCFLVVLVLVSLFSSVYGEIIVADYFGDSVSLPTFGGNNETGGYTVPNPLIPTSPYVLQILITDTVESTPSGPLGGPANETFYVHTANNFGGVGLYGNATLQSMYYVTSIAQGFAAANSQPHLTTQLGTQLRPNNVIGSYFYTFTIPVGGQLQLAITYNVTANPVEADEIIIIIGNTATPIIVGDPQFVGLRGQSYQVHGVDGAVYNIISEQNTQVNSRFAFLSEGKCPIFNAQPDTNCWSHPGSYLGELSFQQVVDGKIHAALVTAGSAKTGFSGIQMDGKALKIGDTVTFGTFSLQYESTHRVLVQTENYGFELSNSDMFINQAVRVRTSLTKLTGHGLLGQTHSTKVYPNALRYIQGEVDDYLIGDNDIFGDDFVFNQFQA